MKVLTIGSAVWDTSVLLDPKSSMTWQKDSDDGYYLQLDGGAKIEIKQKLNFTGGGATNAAVSFRKQAIEVSFFGIVGIDFASQHIINELEYYAINTEYVQRSQQNDTASSLVFPSPSGDRTVLSYRGANSELVFENHIEKPIRKHDLLYITSLGKEASKHLPYIVNEAKRQGCKTVVNPGATQLHRDESFIGYALAGIDAVIVNMDEAKMLMHAWLDSSIHASPPTGQSANAPQASVFDKPIQYHTIVLTLKDYFQYLLNAGPDYAVVTDGASGVYVATKTALYFHPSLKTSVTNTLGAGDAFGSTFTAWLFSGASIYRSIAAGLINSASVVRYIDSKSGLKSWQTIQEEFDQFSYNDLISLSW